MPTWGQILKELQDFSKANHGMIPFDPVRRKYLDLLYKQTGRQTILYATKWTQGDAGGADTSTISISDEDIQGLMEVIYGLKSKSLDLILHSPGGSAEAAEAIVTYLRSKFDDIRVIIPQAAMSAATMIACSSDCILMGKHSSIGPIDPQFILQTPLGVRSVPAHAIINQFRLAQGECVDPKKLTSWLPILSQYGPGLLVQCESAITLSRSLVSKWLKTYMFKGAATNPADEIAKYLSSHGNFNSHGRHISIVDAQKLGLIVESLEENHQLQEKVLSVYHATMHTFTGTAALKIIENHLGRAFVKVQKQIMLPSQPPPPSGFVPIQHV
jgi:hypothetical protein